MVETQFCKMRGTSDTFFGRAYSILYLLYGFCGLNLPYDYLYSVSQKIVRACSLFYPYEIYRSVTPLDATPGVNRTIFHNHSVHSYHLTLIKDRDYIKHNIIKIQ